MLLLVLLTACESGEQYSYQLPMVINPQGEKSYPEPSDPSPEVGGIFDVRVKLSAQSQQIKLGETLILNVLVENQSAGCQYPLYEVSIQEQQVGGFEFVTPQVIGPPGETPAQFEVRAIQVGEWGLFGQAYGEKNCGEGWQWQYVGSEPITISVQP